MNRILFTAFIILALPVAMIAQQIKDPNAQVRSAKDFHAIDIGNAFDVYLTQGNEEAVAVSSTDPKYLDKIVVEVRNGVLHVGLVKGFRINLGNKNFKAYISFKNIDNLEISGACDAKMEGVLKADKLDLELSGASNLTIKLDVRHLDVDVSGASDMKASGTVTDMKVDASGASRFKGFDLQVDYCVADASGASDIRITVNKELSVHASGASDIDYKGDGVIRDLKTNGASSVSRVGS